MRESSWRVITVQAAAAAAAAMRLLEWDRRQTGRQAGRQNGCSADGLVVEKAQLVH